VRFAKPPPPIGKEKLLICEGLEECAFIDALRGHHDLPDFHVSWIGEQGTGNGVTGLKAHLIKAVGLTGFSGVRDIGILVDSDHDQGELFGIARQHITEANSNVDVAGRYAVPQQQFQKANGGVNVTVIMQPGQGQTGCLETLLWQVFSKLHQDKAQCVEEILNCAGVNQGENKWSASKLDKARVRIAVAICYRRNPALSLSYLWKECPDLIPADDAYFIPVCNALGLV
jgi:hypothetical protein